MSLPIFVFDDSPKVLSDQVEAIKALCPGRFIDSCKDKREAISKVGSNSYSVLVVDLCPSGNRPNLDIFKSFTAWNRERAGVVFTSQNSQVGEGIVDEMIEALDGIRIKSLWKTEVRNEARRAGKAFVDKDYQFRSSF